MRDLAEHLSQPVATAARTDFAVLRPEMTVHSALSHIRETGIGEKIIYFYVVDADERLIGVMPTRRLLTNSLERQISELMVPGVLAIPHTASLLEACEMFVLHKFLAFPVVDENRRMLGVIDIAFFASEVFKLGEEEKPDEVFEVIGLHVEQLRNLSTWRGFQARFPWLVGTISSGIACAFLVGSFEETLAHALALAFFLPLVLGMNESVAMQSMSVSLQSLRGRGKDLQRKTKSLRREVGTLALLALGSAVTAAFVVAVWRRSGTAAAVMGITILITMIISGAIGFGVPLLLRLRQRDPKLAAGPVALALVDVSCLLLYFLVAKAAF